MNIQKVIRSIFFALFFLAPLVMSSVTSEIFEFNKIVLIYFCTVLISSLYLIDIVWNKRSIQKSHIFSFVLLFVLSQVFSTIFSIDRHTSLYGYYGRFNGGLVSIFSYVVLLFVFVQVFTQKHLITFLKISMASTVVVMLWGLSSKMGADFSCLLFAGELTTKCWTEQFQPQVRMFSTLGQPNWLGAYLAIQVFIGLFFVFKNLIGKNNEKFAFTIQYVKNLVSQWNIKATMYAIFVFFTVLCIVFTGSRSSLLAVVVSGAFCLYVLLWKNLKQFSKFFMGGILVIIFGISVYLSTIDLSSIKQTNVTESFDIRKVVWKGAVDLGMQYPFLGTGVETFAYSYYFTRPIQHNLTSEWDFLYNKAHNEFLNYFATTGFIGLFAYLAMIISVMWIMIQKVHTAEKTEDVFFYLAMIGAYMTIHVTNFFGFSTTTVQLFFYIIPACIISWNITSLLKPVGVRNASIRYLGVLSLLLSCLYLLIQVLNFYTADRLYAEANKQLGVDYQHAISLLDQAIELHYEHVYEDKLSTVLASLAYIVNTQEETGQEQLITQLMQLSANYNEKTLLLSSKNILYWKTKAKNEYLYYEITRDKKYINEAIKSLDSAQKLAPTDPKLIQSQALFYSTLATATTESSQQKQYKAKALELMDKAIMLKPGFDEAIEMRKQLLTQ